MKDRAARIAQSLVEHSLLSIFSATDDLVGAVMQGWPSLTRDEARRAVSIFLELRRADDDFARFGVQPRFGVPPAH